jgi:hypothetical protein
MIKILFETRTHQGRRKKKIFTSFLLRTQLNLDSCCVKNSLVTYEIYGTFYIPTWSIVTMGIKKTNSKTNFSQEEG